MATVTRAQHTSPDQSRVVIRVYKQTHIVDLEQLGVMESQNTLENDDFGPGNGVEMLLRPDTTG
jgi:hypothetical protein